MQIKTKIVSCRTADSKPVKQEVNGTVILSLGNTKGGSITVWLTSCLTGLDLSILQIKTKIVSCHTAESKPVKQEVNGTVILSLGNTKGGSISVQLTSCLTGLD